jgi:adenine/guanine phosphoribosyltransferase-like PRPP-binding protein
MSARTGQAPTTPIHGDGYWAMPPPGSRSADEIRRDIVTQRRQLSRSVDALRSRMSEITNIRRQVSEHRTEIIVGAAAVGFLIGGAIALRRRR